MPIAEMPRMSDYGVGGAEWKPLPWSWAATRLAATHNFWLVTVGADGRPHSMPVWGVWHEPTERFAFGCSADAKKARNIAANSAVAFTNDDTTECVSVQGTATLVSAGSALDDWVSLFVAKYGAESGPDFGEFMRRHPMFEVTPTAAFGIIERPEEFAARATRWRFS